MERAERQLRLLEEARYSKISVSDLKQIFNALWKNMKAAMEMKNWRHISNYTHLYRTHVSEKNILFVVYCVNTESYFGEEDLEKLYFPLIFKSKKQLRHIRTTESAEYISLLDELVQGRKPSVFQMAKTFPTEDKGKDIESGKHLMRIIVGIPKSAFIKLLVPQKLEDGSKSSKADPIFQA